MTLNGNLNECVSFTVSLIYRLQPPSLSLSFSPITFSLLFALASSSVSRFGLEPHFRFTPHCVCWAAALCKYFYSALPKWRKLWHGRTFNRFSSLAMRKIKQTTPDPIHAYVCCPAILPLVLIFRLFLAGGSTWYVWMCVCVCVYCVFLQPLWRPRLRRRNRISSVARADSKNCTVSSSSPFMRASQAS